MNRKKMKRDAMANIGGHHCHNLHQGERVICIVEYRNGHWTTTVPGEGTAMVRDSKQMRAVVAMLMNKEVSMEPDDIEDAASTGPVVVRRGVPVEDEPQASQEGEDEDPMEEDIDPSDDGDADGQDVNLAFEGTVKSGSDPDLLMLWGVRLSRHTGDTCDYGVVHDLDHRVAMLDAGIKATKASDVKMAAALNEERTALRKYRDWYVNSITGKRRPFYSTEVDEKVHRCRMWMVRGVQKLAAKGLAKAAASLNGAISRGMDFIYDEQPGYKWVVTLPPSGSLPVFPKANGSEVAA